MYKEIKKRRPSIVPIAVFILFLCCVLAESTYNLIPFYTDPHPYPRGLGDYYYNHGFFRIYPETLIESLDNGKSDAFFPETSNIDEMGWRGPALYDKPIQWDQLDYIKIIDALNRYVWKDNLNDWNVYSLYFYADCQNSNGFWEGEIIYYKTIFNNGRFEYITRYVLIEPTYLDVAWGGGVNFPRPPLGWKKINLSKLKILANDALRIAEENGGREVRLKARDDCRAISVRLQPESGNPGWVVDYGSSDYHDFVLQIDPYTGEIIK